MLNIFKKITRLSLVAIFYGIVNNASSNKLCNLTCEHKKCTKKLAKNLWSLCILTIERETCNIKRQTNLLQGKSALNTLCAL